MSQQHTSRFSSSHGAPDPKLSNQDNFAANLHVVAVSPASTFKVVSGADAVCPVKPTGVVYPLQASADDASLKQFSLVEAGRSDPGRQVYGTSDQRLSAVSADQQTNGFQSFSVNLPVWTPLPLVVPS